MTPRGTNVEKLVAELGGVRPSPPAAHPGTEREPLPDESADDECSSVVWGAWHAIAGAQDAIAGLRHTIARSRALRSRAQHLQDECLRLRQRRLASRLRRRGDEASLD